MTRKEYERKYFYLGNQKDSFNVKTYKAEERYWDRRSIEPEPPEVKEKPQVFATGLTLFFVIDILYHIIF